MPRLYFNMGGPITGGLSLLLLLSPVAQGFQLPHTVSITRATIRYATIYHHFKLYVSPVLQRSLLSPRLPVAEARGASSQGRRQQASAYTQARLPHKAPTDTRNSRPTALPRRGPVATVRTRRPRGDRAAPPRRGRSRSTSDRRPNTTPVRRPTWVSHAILREEF